MILVLWCLCSPNPSQKVVHLLICVRWQITWDKRIIQPILYLQKKNSAASRSCFGKDSTSYLSDYIWLFHNISGLKRRCVHIPDIFSWASRISQRALFDAVFFCKAEFNCYQPWVTELWITCLLALFFGLDIATSELFYWEHYFISK